MTRVLLSVFLFSFFVKLNAAETYELMNKRWNDQARKSNFKTTPEEIDDITIHVREIEEILSKTELEEREEAVSLGADFLSLLGYVVNKYPSAVYGLYHAIRHDLDNGQKNNLTIWELLALKDFLNLKHEIFEQLLSLSEHNDDCVGQTDPANMDKLKRELFAGYVMDLGRNVVALTPAAWDIARNVMKYASPARVLKAVDDGIRYALIATPLAYASVSIDLLNTAALIRRGEHFVFTSFRFMDKMFPVELLNLNVKEIYKEGSYLERWLTAAIALIVCDLNHVGVLANYAHAGINLAQIVVISAAIFPGATLPSTIAGLSLAAVDHSVTLKAKFKNKKASEHKDIIVSLTGRILTNNVMIDYLKELGIFQRSLSSKGLRKNLSQLKEEKLWAFHKLMSLVFKRYLFP